MTEISRYGRVRDPCTDVSGSKDDEAMATRHGGQFKSSGVAGGLIITPAVNI